MKIKKLKNIKDTEYVSNCCSVPVNTDYLICDECGEHCEVREVK